MLIIEVTNPGLKTVTINGPHLRLPDGRSLIMPIPNSNIKFPFELEKGRMFSLAGIRRIEADIIRFRSEGSNKIQSCCNGSNRKRIF